MPLPARRLALAAVALIAACKGAAPPAASTSTAVTLTPSDVATARLDTVTDAVSISGPLEPGQTVLVRTQINAIVRGVHADRGSPVHRGDVLIELDAEGLRGQAAGAKAAIAAADANLALANQRLESAKRLEAAGAISQVELKTAE